MVQSIPISVPSSARFKEVSCGLHHVLAVTVNGAVFAWGSNQSGQLGLGTLDPTSVHTPREVSTMSPPRECAHVAGGEAHSLLLTVGGAVFACGEGTYGQLGVGDLPGKRARGADERRSTTCLPAFTKVVWNAEDDPAQMVSQVSAGWGHSAFVTVSGELYTFGWGFYQQLGHGTSSNELVPRLVEALHGVGEMDRISGIFSGIRAVACGTWHTACISTTGDLYTWGWGKHGQLGHARSCNHSGISPGAGNAEQYLSEPIPRVVDLDAILEDPVLHVSCAPRKTVILTRSGAIYGWGDLPSHDRIVTIPSQLATAKQAASNSQDSPSIILAQRPFENDGCWTISIEPIEQPMGPDSTEDNKTRNISQKENSHACRQSKCISIASGMWYDALVIESEM